MERKKTRVTPEQLKNMKGKTQWAKLLAEEKSSNKQIQPTRKPRG